MPLVRECILQSSSVGSRCPTSLTLDGLLIVSSHPDVQKFKPTALRMAKA